MAHIAVISEEQPDNSWVAAIAEYKSRELFEYYDGDCERRIIETCGHRHRAADNKAITNCQLKLCRKLQ